jgi:uncharacterized alpha-E superfamily protein
MLSRIAESLYWLGRYTERAEDTARLLDIAQRASLEGADLGSAQVLSAVFGGAAVPGTRAQVHAAYCLDRYLPESVSYSVRAARENARTIREALPSEMWEALNTWHLQVAAAGRNDLAGGGAHAVLRDYVIRAYQLAGIVEGTMARDESWDWLTIGRYLERAVFTARVLAVRAPQLSNVDSSGSAAEAYGYAVLLRAFSADEAFRARYRAEVDARRVLEFLLLDERFPRSALYAVQRIDEAAARVTDQTYGLAARREAGRLRGDLEFREIDDILAEQGVVVARVLGRCQDLHEALVD